MNIHPFDPKNLSSPNGNAPGGFRIHNMLSSVKRTFFDAGAVVGKYRIIHEIDRGGMAVVYKALQMDLEREVALKVMPANITINYRFVERFLSEAHSVAKLSHPYIVNIYEVAAQDSAYYLAMELIKGKNLYHHLHEYKPKLVDVLEIVSKLAEALFYAHSQKIIHRDLKLNNVIMKEPLLPVLIDFGLAKAMEDADGGITRTGEIMGSPAYMAPERLLGSNMDHRSDICSLGIMLYEMLTFKNPYLDQRNLHQTTLNVMEANPVPPKKLIPWLPDEIEAVTLKAMAKDPAARYQSMEEFQADIRRYQKGDTVLARPPSFSKRTTRFMRKKWATIAISALIMIICGIFAANHYIQSKKGSWHWQLVHSKFPASPEEWVFGPDAGKVDTENVLSQQIPFPKPSSLQLPSKQKEGGWQRTDRFLWGYSEGFSYARLEWRFNRDVLIEVDIQGSVRDIFNAGIFLFGNNPQNAYCIHINRGGSGESGITFPGSDFLFQDIESGKVPWRAKNRVVIERARNTISLSINGVLISKVYDFFPLIDKDHEKIGFFVNGSNVNFSNLKIYRPTTPMTPSPTLIADRFWEKGYFEEAINEYKGLMIDRSALIYAKDLHLKIADCQIRLGHYDEALTTLAQSSRLQSGGELRVRSKLLNIVAYQKSGNTEKADSVSKLMAENHESAAVNYYVMSSKIINCVQKIDAGDLRGAQADIKKYAALYPKFSAKWGSLHLRLLAILAQQGDVEQALTLSNEISAIYRQNSEIPARAKTLMGKAYLNAGQVSKASEMFNQSIHTFNTSDNIWEAWFKLAQIYEYDFDYNHALSLYLKIWKECPPTSEIFWMAALKCAEYNINDETPAAVVPLLHEIVNGDHPFPLPRLIANYYLDRVDEKAFRKSYSFLYPADPWHQYYTARKQLLQGNREQALITLGSLRRQLPQNSWRTLQVLKIQRTPQGWK
ncbi:MAG: protein kinase [Chitinispirillales bacterium]|jgi:serine/threonine protein kinase/tetratricopeptide (TPR) repeat protein|nr:protein kinase [Chitinispirillales bacterium]